MNKKSSGNTDQIPHDLALTRNPNKPQDTAATTSEETDHNRFEVQQSNSLKDDYLKRIKKAESDATATSSKTAQVDHAVSGDNYLKAYLDERAQQDEARAAAQKDAVEKTRVETEKRQKDDMAKRQADDHRFRARELQNQIQWWRQQEGAGTHDSATIQGQISNLEWQLTTIPREFWS
jgi:hypothetical protein